MSESSNPGGPRDAPMPDPAASSGAPANAASTNKVRPPTPKNCRNFIRRKTADAMPKIVDAFVEKAIGGSVPHFASLAKVGGFDQKPAPPPPPRRRGKSLARRLLDEVERFEAKHGIKPPGEANPQPGDTTPEESV